MNFFSRRAVFPMFVLPLAACAGVRSETAALLAKMHPLTDAEVSDLWAIAKGIGLVALTTLPASSPIAAAILAAFDIADPLVKDLATISDTPTRQAAVAAIQSQAAVVLLNGAPKITAEPNS
jgi:hypothetical protein